MRITHQEIPYSRYLLQPTLALPPLGIYYLQYSLSKEGIIWGAFAKKELVGVAILESIPHPQITFLYVKEPFRGKGIGRELVRTALELMGTRGKRTLRASVVVESPHGQVVDAILQKEGFIVMDTATLIRYARGETCSQKWHSFMKRRGKRIVQHLEGRGFNTFSLAIAPKAALETLQAAIGKTFPDNLDPSLFTDNAYDRLVPEYSFITRKGDEPVAFVLATTADDRTLVFQQLSVAFRYQGSGTFLLPFAAFMAKFLEGEGFNKVSAMIVDGNAPMQRLVQSFIGSLAESRKTQQSYSAHTCNVK